MAREMCPVYLFICTYYKGIDIVYRVYTVKILNVCCLSNYLWVIQKKEEQNKNKEYSLLSFRIAGSQVERSCPFVCQAVKLLRYCSPQQIPNSKVYTKWFTFPLKTLCELI